MQNDGIWIIVFPCSRGKNADLFTISLNCPQVSIGKPEPMTVRHCFRPWRKRKVQSQYHNQPRPGETTGKLAYTLIPTSSGKCTRSVIEDTIYALDQKQFEALILESFSYH